MISEAYNMDCLEAMRAMPDNAFDLAVVDPPYGDGNAVGLANASQDMKKPPPKLRGGGRHYSFGGRKKEKTYQNRRDLGTEIRKKIVAWDMAPEKEYFEQLFRVSRNQIIWGGNYFELPPTRCFLVWRKLSITESFSMAMAEYAWTSFTGNAKVFECAPQGKPGDRFHPTQKPIELYAWIYNLFAKPGMKILDTHLGSGSSRIAAYNAGLDFVGYEIDKDYFDKQEERFARHTAQMNLFQWQAETERAEDEIGT